MPYDRSGGKHTIELAMNTLRTVAAAAIRLAAILVAAAVPRRRHALSAREPSRGAGGGHRLGPSRHARVRVSAGRDRGDPRLPRHARTGSARERLATLSDLGDLA